MSFQFRTNDYGAPASRITSVPYTTGAATAGLAVKLDGGVWVPTDAGDEIGGFLNHNITAEQGRECEVIRAREGDVYEARYTGTAGATFVPGAAVDIAADGLSVDAESIEGPLILLDIKPEKNLCFVKVKERQLS